VCPVCPLIHGAHHASGTGLIIGQRAIIKHGFQTEGVMLLHIKQGCAVLVRGGKVNKEARGQPTLGLNMLIAPFILYLKLCHIG